MPKIILHTKIKAPLERCFRLSLSVDVHMSSTSNTREKAIAGVTSGVMKLNDTVTWRARHFGVMQTLTSKITVCNEPHEFVDEMVKGIFQRIHHRHIFRAEGQNTCMTDEFEYEAPLGILGQIAERLLLTDYLRRFLIARNAYIAELAEGEDWRKYLENAPTDDIKKPV